MEHAIPIGAGRWSAAPIEWKLQWILRVAVALEFVGHGLFGVIGKEAWLAYYDVFGISADHGRILMPITGGVDITLGILVLIRPTRILIGYMAVWGLLTASLRPLADQGVWELVERSYNYGVPLMLLLLLGLGRNPGEWVGRARAMPRLTRRRAATFFRGFQWIIGLYLIGHGALGLVDDKPSLIGLYDSVGLTSLVDDPASLNTYVGAFEIVLGVAVLAIPATSLLLFVLAYKLGTEFLHVTAGVYGSPLEVIERAGCYAAPIAAIICRRVAQGQDQSVRTPASSSAVAAP
jgi:uncharacterized membrane protein YphA (DoxX/SURF4 family)